MNREIALSHILKPLSRQVANYISHTERMFDKISGILGKQSGEESARHAAESKAWTKTISLPLDLRLSRGQGSSKSRRKWERKIKTGRARRPRVFVPVKYLADGAVVLSIQETIERLKVAGYSKDAGYLRLVLADLREVRDSEEELAILKRVHSVFESRTPQKQNRPNSADSRSKPESKTRSSDQAETRNAKARNMEALQCPEGIGQDFHEKLMNEVRLRGTDWIKCGQLKTGSESTRKKWLAAMTGTLLESNGKPGSGRAYRMSKNI